MAIIDLLLTKWLHVQHCSLQQRPRMMEDPVEVAAEERLNSSGGEGESSDELQQVSRAAEDASEPDRASRSDSPSNSADPVRTTTPHNIG